MLVSRRRRSDVKKVGVRPIKLLTHARTHARAYTHTHTHTHFIHSFIHGSASHSFGASTLTADETYPRQASLSTAAARHDLSSVDFRRVPVFPPSPFVFHVGPAFAFKESGSLVDCVSPVRSIGCLYCPLAVIDVACNEGPFQSVFVSLF